MSESVFVVFTRNWIDLKGNGHGFRYASTGSSAFAEFAKQSARSSNEHPVAGASKWEVAELPASVIIQHVIAEEAP